MWHKFRQCKLAWTALGGLWVTVCAASALLAADPPPWRGVPGSTYQEWLFTTSANPATPEQCDNPFGTPSATIDYEPPYGTGWKNSLPPVYGSAQGWWDIARGSITLSIATHPGAGDTVVREIQVVVQYWVDINRAPTVEVLPTGTVTEKTTSLVESGPVGGAWYSDVWKFRSEASENPLIVRIKGDPLMGSQVDRVAVDTLCSTRVTSAARARQLPDSTNCELSGPVVTRVFEGFFYVEDANRAAGIRVNCAQGQMPAEENTTPTVTGVVRTIGGERVIDEAHVVPGGSGTVKPLGMLGRATLSGLNTQGLLVYLWGRAKVDSAGTTQFVIDDGSTGDGVVVELHGVAAPTDGDYIVVSGVLGANNGMPVLRVGSSDTIVVAQ